MTKEELVELLKQDLHREWQHMAFYLTTSSLVTGLHREEYREFLFSAAQSEMTHVKEFQDMILGLETEVKMIGFYNIPKNIDLIMPSFGPNRHNPFFDIKNILEDALFLEQQVTKNYVERIAQAEELGGVDGKWVAIFLEDQLKHSREDADNIKQILRGI